MINITLTHQKIIVYKMTYNFLLSLIFDLIETARIRLPVRVDYLINYQKNL